MVDFSVFNELSLPLDKQTAKEKFGLFFTLLKELKSRGLNQIRMSERFKNYEIVEGSIFQNFLGQQDREFKGRLRSFLSNATVIIASPIIQENEQEQREAKDNSEYFYDNRPINGGLACCDIWNTLAISFNSDSWNANNIDIQKHVIDENSNIIKSAILIKHASEVGHLSLHKNFFDDLEGETKNKITQENFWAKKNELFPSKIIFCEEVERQIQIKQLDKKTFKYAISILRDIETGKKPINQLTISGEGETVKTNPKLRSKREFSISGKKEFFEKHIKNFPNNQHRIYFLERYNKIYIGYIGKHLPTASNSS